MYALRFQATVGALGMLSAETQIYSARPVLVSGSCKRESGFEHAKLLRTTLEGCHKTTLRTICISSDGESRRGEALVIETFKHPLTPHSPIYPFLHVLPLMNLEVGEDDLTADKDYKHIFKRLRNLFLRLRGFMVHGIHITQAVVRSHLRSNDVDPIRVDNLLKPEDKQDVKLAYDLLREIWSLPPASAPSRPGFSDTHDAFRTLGALCRHLLLPFICVDLSLSEQLTHLSAAAHMLLAMLREDNAGSMLMPTQLYIDIMIMIKNVYFCVAKCKVDNPSGQFWIILLGTDRLKELFGILRTMVGNDANLDILQLVLRLTGTTEVSTILAKYPQWDRAPRRLKLPALSKDGLDVHKGVDHIKPASWRGNVEVSLANLQTCWKLGRQMVEREIPRLGQVLRELDSSSTTESQINILCPFGKDLVHAKRDADDYDDTTEDFEEAAGSHSDLPPEPDLEDAAAEEEPSGKHNPCFDLDGEQIYKARYLNQLFKDFKNPGSRDRLKRVANVPRYAIKRDNHSDIVNYDSTSGAPSICMDSPIATLVGCEDYLFVCIGEVNDITFDSKHMEQITLDLLLEPSVYVSYQVLYLVPATADDDPELKNDWRWSHNRGPSHQISGRLVEAVNPAISTRDAGKPFYLFESGVLMALGSVILERLTHDDGRLLPKVVPSKEFPYREATGASTNMQNLHPSTDFSFSLSGKACFVCRDDGKEQDLIKHRQCPSCTPTIKLPKSAQRVLEHMAAHIHFDPGIDSTKEPCGFCLRPSPLCVFYLKKGKGADASQQLDYARSTCANMTTFSYSVAALSSASSPCSNVPIRCSWCSDSAAAVWRYNMPHHVKAKHPYVSLQDHGDVWKIGNSEKHELRRVWDNRHKVKKSRKKNKASMTLLNISDAHSSHLALR